MNIVAIGKMIKELLDKADVVEDEKKDWPEDQDMVRMYEADARDMRSIAETMKDGQFVDAFYQMSMMDTAARDMIPKAAWLYCLQKNQQQEKEAAKNAVKKV